MKIVDFGSVFGGTLFLYLFGSRQRHIIYFILTPTHHIWTSDLLV